MPARAKWRDVAIREGHRSIERSHRRKLADRVTDARKTLREHVRKGRAACSATYQDTIEKTRAAYRKAMEDARKARKQKRQAARTRCAREREIREASDRSNLALAVLEQVHERIDRQQAKLRASHERSRQKSRATAHERRTESDDEVAQNIDPALLTLWRKVKRSIRGDARKSRTEAFLEYVESHPDEQFQALEEDVAREWAREMAKHPKLAKSGKELRRKLVAGEVPF